MGMQTCIPQGLWLALLIRSLSSIAASLPVRLSAESPLSQLQLRLGAAAAASAPPYDFSNKPAPRGHLKLDSASRPWARDTQKARKRLLSKSRSFGAELEALGKDDAVEGKKDSDSNLWTKLSDFKVADTSEYWSVLCNGTNMVNNSLIGDVPKLNLTKVLADWKVYGNSTCKDKQPLVYTSKLKAFLNCGAACTGIIEQDYGTFKSESKSKKKSTNSSTQNAFNQMTNKTSNKTSSKEKKKPTKEYVLCKLTTSFGHKRKKAMNRSVIDKPKTYKEPKGLPRPPQELKFWANFCEYRKLGRMIRVMYEGKNCAKASMKVLEGKEQVANPVECAALTDKDDECAKPKVFDFRFGPPTVCRCVKAEKDCEPEVADGGNVWSESLQEAITPPPTPAPPTTTAAGGATTTAAPTTTGQSS